MDNERHAIETTESEIRDLRSKSELSAGLSAAARELLNAALDVIQEDPHQWSARPCSTCRAVSAIAKRPFGCELLRQQKGR